MTFKHVHRVRSYEVDHQGIVFNGRFLEIADDAMTEFFRHLGFDYPELISVGFDPAIVAIDLQFRSPARLDDELAVVVGCERVGTSSVTLGFEISRGADEVARVTTTYVNVTSESISSRPIPEAVAGLLSAAAAEGRGELPVRAQSKDDHED